MARKCKHLHRRVSKHYLYCAEDRCKKRIRKLESYEQYQLVFVGLKQIKDTPEEIKDYVTEARNSEFSLQIRGMKLVTEAKELIQKYG